VEETTSPLTRMCDSRLEEARERSILGSRREAAARHQQAPKKAEPSEFQPA
jgi:hypothetical protein